jgi:hypothetical protein
LPPRPLLRRKAFGITRGFFFLLKDADRLDI